MNNSKEYVWYTGDWKIDSNNLQVPYNGLKIGATAKYSAVTSPPTSQKLVSVDLVVVDYTYNPQGVTSPVLLYKTGVWFDIPIPTKEGVSPPEENKEFTVVGTDSIDELGKVKLEANSAGIFLNIQFRYGIDTMKREELGFIMKFDETYQDGEDPVQVEK